MSFKYGGALETADRVMTFKLAVKTIAHKHGLHATFMPKPVFGIAGSGMHVNLSITQNGSNIFCDEKDVNGLSKQAYAFIAGITAHIKGITGYCWEIPQANTLCRFEKNYRYVGFPTLMSLIPWY